MRLVFWVSLLIFLMDQMSKYVVVRVMDLRTQLAIDVLPPFLNFRMAWNEGINFGLFPNASHWVWIILSLMVVAFVLWWVAREQGGLRQRVSAGLLVGGALGNVIDRLIYEAVADFLNMSCCGFNNPYAFNVADIAVFAGAFGLILFTSDKKPS